MATYIMLLKWTQAGLGKIKELPQRLEKSRETFKSVGAELKAYYFTMGRYDAIAIVEGPSDEAIGKAVLIVGQMGAVNIETLKAFPEAEGYEIIRSLP